MAAYFRSHSKYVPALWERGGVQRAKHWTYWIFLIPQEFFAFSVDIELLKKKKLIKSINLAADFSSLLILVLCKR